MFHVVISDCVAPLSSGAIGPRITHRNDFFPILYSTVMGGIKDKDNWRDTYCEIVLPRTVHEFASSGIGLRSRDPSQYTCACELGRVDAYLKREYALPVRRVVVTVQTIEHYKARQFAADFDVYPFPHLRDHATQGTEVTHVIAGLKIEPQLQGEEGGVWLTIPPQPHDALSQYCARTKRVHRGEVKPDELAKLNKAFEYSDRFWRKYVSVAD